MHRQDIKGSRQSLPQAGGEDLIPPRSVSEESGIRAERVPYSAPLEALREASPAADAAAHGPRAESPYQRPLHGSPLRSQGRLLTPKMVGELALGLDCVLILATAYGSGILYSRLFYDYWGDLLIYLGVSLVIIIAWLAVSLPSKAYSPKALQRLRDQVPSLVLRWAAVFLGLVAIAFLTKTSAAFSRGWTVLWFGMGLSALIGTRVWFRHFLRSSLARSDRLARRVAVVGATETCARFMDRVRKDDPSVRFVGVFDDRRTRLSATGMDLRGGLEDLMRLGRHNQVDEVVICLPWAAERRIVGILRRLAVLPIAVHLCPEGVGLKLQSTHVATMAGTVLLEANRRPLSGWGAVIKSIEDRVLSSVCLILLAPLFAVIALAIKLESRGPVFFRQQRHGFNDQVFRIFKFRTMTVLEDGPVVVQAKQDDARVTRVGRFLRRYSLDELPQLLNVVRGHMSIIGPRPHAVAHNSHYGALISDYARRHRVLPGMTGLAQVRGLRGEIQGPEQMARRLEADLYYIENWSLGLDIRILFQTVGAVLFPRNAW